MAPADGEPTRDCWSVAFGNSYDNEQRMVCAGYENGDVKMFDLRTMSLHWEGNVKNGVCSIEFDRRDIPMNKLVVTSLEASFRVYDLRTKHSSKGFAHVAEKKSSNDEEPMGVPGTVEKLNNCSAAEQPVSAFDWSVDKKGLCVYSAFDQQVRVSVVTKLDM
ncbi:hypothetical protein HK101_005639 [Irineochytrium annulatum]|nr:hypothetical protein HK101_005639 [Irineochytrium annulatum]